MPTHRSFCRICTSLCGVLVDTDGDTVVRVRGDREHPLSKGYTCPKGRALPKMHHHSKRIEYPQLNSQQCSWQSALDDLAEKLKRIIAEHGPAAVGIYFGSGVGMDASGYKMSETLQSAIGTPAKFSPLTIDGTAKVLVSSLMAHFPGFNARPDYDQAKLLLLIGVNPVVSHGHATATPLPPPKALRDIRDRGEVWVIDPRRSESVEFATQHLAPTPGTDYAILGYLLRETLQQPLPDKLSQRIQQLDALRSAVEPFTLARASQLAEVPQQNLAKLFDALQRHGRIAIDTGTGVTMSRTANITQWFAWALMVLTDSINQPGGVWFHPGFITPLDAAPLPEIPPEILFAPGPASRPELQSFLGEWPCAALADEIDAGNIRAFLNLGGNLITAFPDEHRLRPALEKLEVFASLDIIHNETTALSSHVLPTKDQLERADITLWDILSSRVSAQYTPAVTTPVGERRSSWWILAELIKRLGSDLCQDVPGDDRPESDAHMLARTMINARCDFETLARESYQERPRELPAPWVNALLDTVGGWRLAPDKLVEQLAALNLGADANNNTETGNHLRLIPRRQKRHVNAQLLYLGDEPEILLHPQDATARKIDNGSAVKVKSVRGSLRGIAKVTAEVKPGVVSVPHGFESANVNRLTDTAIADPVSGMAWYSGLPVDVAPI